MGLQIPRRVYSQMPQEDALRPIAPTPWGSFQEACGAEGKPNRGRAFDGRSCAYDDRHPTEVRGFAGGWIYQRQERHSFGAGLWRAKAEFCRATFLGAGIFRLNRWAR